MGIPLPPLDDQIHIAHLLNKMNVIDRGFVSREGNSYTITAKGRGYISGFSQVADDPKQAVLRAVNEFNNAQRQAPCVNSSA